MSYPSPENVHIVPTAREPDSGLALSSRNRYLSEAEKVFAPTLYKALKIAETRWDGGASKKECISTAVDFIHATSKNADKDGVYMKLDYIEMNDSDSFDVLDENSHRNSSATRRNPVILSGAVMVGKTRVIDNILLSEEGKILINY
jgi:pantoate--beta-alanine ligase